MNEEMRKEFEVFYIRKYGSLSTYKDDYVSGHTKEHWRTWQASREAMRPIKLPDATFETPSGDSALREDAVLSAIESAGYKVAP